MWYNKYNRLLEDADGEFSDRVEEGDPNDYDDNDTDTDKEVNEASFYREMDAIFEENIENDNGMIDSDHYDDEVDPSTVVDLNDEKDNYDKDPSKNTDVTDYMNQDNDDGTEEVEVESFTGWDDLF